MILKRFIFFTILLIVDNTFCATTLSLNEQIVQAIEDGDLQTVNDLVSLDINFKKDGQSLVEIACFKGHKAIAALIVKNGAIIPSYCMVDVSDQIVFKEKLLACGLEVTSIGILAYVKNTSKRMLKCEELFFLRHGNTFATENKIFTDTDNKVAFLTAKGKSEIEMIADEIIKIKPDVIITSSLTRCKESLEIVLEKLGTDFQDTMEIKELKSIRGICHGNWEGKNKEELIGEDLLTWFAKWNSYVFAKSPGGESLAEVLIRANELLDFIDENYQSKKVLVVGHGSFSWALTILLKVFPDPSNNDYHIQYGELKKLY